MRVVLTGGGTGGHVIPNLAIIEELRKHRGIELLYIGSRKGLEKAMVEKAGVDYKGIFCGKLRRYFSFDNFVDIFKMPLGLWQAYRILKSFKPDVIFAKGGFVSVPVVCAAGWLKIPVILHESDIVPGLANKLCANVADKICISFEESRQYFGKYAEKVVLTGNPVRILNGDKEKGFKFCSLRKGKPVLLVIGGSQGAMQINDLVRAGLEELLRKFQIVHIRGRGNLDLSLERKGYVQYEYVDEEIADIYAISDVVVSRGGANSLAEIAFLKKKAVIIPLGGHASRGDQINNAEVFARDFGWEILAGNIDSKDFIQAVNKVFCGKSPSATLHDGTKKIVDLILKI